MRTGECSNTLVRPHPDEGSGLCRVRLPEYCDDEEEKKEGLFHEVPRKWGLGWKDPEFLDSMFEDTWLILPVVICLSRRLSHASLSSNGILIRGNCEWLIKSVLIWSEEAPLCGEVYG